MAEPFIPPPLSLYVHLPWCVRKCPYCDFNSHATRGDLPEAAYVEALLRDLTAELPGVWGRTIQTVFIGGGTPSLFSAASIDRLLAGVRALMRVSPDAEITVEANPGTVEADRFAGYRDAGINRLSLGIQSFEDARLTALGRIHGGDEARRAVDIARAAGFDNINLDLMYALPDQTVDDALRDIDAALSFAPEHLSVYQLTIEPNTYFHAHPPTLPDDDTAFAMQQAIEARLAHAGFGHYEVSAYARDKRRCRHNLNYWTFGDYLGIGAGAHGKITDHRGITRRAKQRAPGEYLVHAGTERAGVETRELTRADTIFEFMLNAARLNDGFDLELFTERTGLPTDALEPQLQSAINDGLLARGGDRISPTAIGRRFLNDLLQRFLSD